MTLPVERTRAVTATRAFLARLLRPADTPGVPRAVRDEASSLLRHYPGDVDLLAAAAGAPATWAVPPSLEQVRLEPSGVPLDALRRAVKECQQLGLDYVAFLEGRSGPKPGPSRDQAEARLQEALGRSVRAVVQAAEDLVA